MLNGISAAYWHTASPHNTVVLRRKGEWNEFLLFMKLQRGCANEG